MAHRPITQHFPYGSTVHLSNSIIEGSNLKIFGDNNNIRSFYGEIVGNNNLIDGSSVNVTGNGNRITSFYGTVTGNHNHIKGSNPEATGNHNTVEGNNATVTGNNNRVDSSNSTVKGNDNHVTGKYADVEGHRNTVDGDNASVAGNQNVVMGQEASILRGNSNTVNGVPAEEERQRRRDNLQRELQDLQNQETNLTIQQQLRMHTLQMRQNLLEMQDQGPGQNLLETLQRQQELFNDQLQEIDLFAPAAPAIYRPRAAARRRLLATQSAANATDDNSMIKLTLRGEDTVWDEDTDLVGSKCLCCWTNQANVAGTCCGKLMACMSCTKSLYEGKHVSPESKCLSCQAPMRHCLRILL